MGEVASAYVSLMPSAKGFGKGISSQIGGDLDTAGREGGKRFGGGMSTGLAGMGKTIFGPLAAIGGAMLVGDFFKGAYDEARESQKVGALTANVIKTTGGAAKVTTAQVGDLAAAISNKTGIDDEAIQSGANLLLTFKNVKNEVGSGAAIFDRATAAAVDLSASGFGDVSGSSKMLGKALNDPIAGITALGRAGVTFTAGQKAQIKAMVESGDVLGAQKMIMKEVESQVGGAAAASATAGEKLSTTWGNFKETIGTALLPVIDTVMGKATEFLGFLMTNIGPAFASVSTFLAPVIEGIKGFFTSFSTGGGPGAITGAFAPLVTFFQTSVVPAVMSIVTAVQSFIAVALPIVQAFVAGMMARIEPMLPTIKAIFATIGQNIVLAMELIRAVIERVTTVIKFVWERWGGSIMSFITGVWSKMLVIIQAALNVIQGVIKTVTSVIKGDWSGAWDGIKQILSGVWSAIKGIISAALNVIGGVISGAWALIKTGVGAAWGGIKTAISSAWDGIKAAVSTKAGELVTFVSGIPGKIVSALGNLGNLLKDAGTAVIAGFFDGLKAKFEEVKSFVTGIGSWIADHKGPISYDRKLLIPAGSAIMSGLNEGINAGFADVQSNVSGLAGRLTMGTLDFASTSARSAAVSGAGSGATSADIAALGDRIGAELERQARTIQTMQRQMAK